MKRFLLKQLFGNRKRIVRALFAGDERTMIINSLFHRAESLKNSDIEKYKAMGKVCHDIAMELMR